MVQRQNKGTLEGMMVVMVVLIVVQQTDEALEQPGLGTRKTQNREQIP